MGFLDYLDRRAERRLTAWREGGRRSFWDRFDARVLIALIVISLFAWAYGENVTDETMKGALIAAFAGAWGYFLGSSAGAARAGERQDRALDLAHTAMEANGKAPTKTLKPGETATAVDD